MKKDLGISCWVSGYHSGFWKPERKLLHNLSTEDVKLVLKKFVSSNTPANHGARADCIFVSGLWWFFWNFSTVLGAQGMESVLNGKSSGAAIKLVDLARVEGACSLIMFI
ncbi:inositol polyphosphate multikinase alpha-like [Neltuma alba]|uniref:inositol polyphosphate multikinase alpha-like n=1 Tax=Neltuma alba TaxID=207710 RepID=UPI0010A2FF9D|nr:inositol polyphosphate multikinase alpha-like [Prosopis alba]